MKADPAVLTLIHSVLGGMSTKERENELSRYQLQSHAAPAAAGQRDLMTVAEAADYLRCSRTTLFREEKAGRIQSVWMRGKKLFRLEDLNNALQDGKVK